MARGWAAQDVTRHALKQQRATQPSKYHNVKITIDGQAFDSKREADRWIVLKASEKTGAIRHLQRQVSFPLYAAVLNTSVPANAQIAIYIADFVYEELAGPDHWERVIEDAKGMKTQIYRLKKKWLFFQQGITIREV